MTVTVEIKELNDILERLDRIEKLLLQLNGSSGKKILKDQSKYYTIKEACELLMISRSQVFVLMKDGKLQSTKTGSNKTLFTVAQLNECINKLNPDIPIKRKSYSIF